jgi:hypothetical protein
MPIQLNVYVIRGVTAPMLIFVVRRAFLLYRLVEKWCADVHIL